MLEPAASGGCELDGLELWPGSHVGAYGVADFSDGCGRRGYSEADAVQRPSLAERKLLAG